MPLNSVDSQMEMEVRALMRGCSETAIEAALRFRSEPHSKWLSTIVLGIFARFVEPSERELVQKAEPHTDLVEDLGIDSLLLIEIVLVIEDVLLITVENDELRELCTLGQVERFLLEKTGGDGPSVPKNNYAERCLPSALTGRATAVPTS